MASEVTEQRRALRAAVAPLLNEGEDVTVAAAPSDFEAGLQTRRFAVTITVGEAGDESAAERLDELLSDVVKSALEDTAKLRPTVRKISGYQSLPRPEGRPLLGATWTAELLS